MARTLLDLAVSIETMSARLPGAVADLKHRVAEHIADDAIDHTPVDTGEHVSSWSAGVGSPPQAHRQPYALGRKGSTAGANRSAAKGAVRAVLTGQSPVGQPVYVANAAPAIATLNGGSSTQEPAGFVERAALKGRLFVRNAKLKL